MRKVAYTLIAVVAAAGVLYALGVGPFKESTATGQQQRGRREGAVSVRVDRVKVGDVEERLSYVGSLLANASVTVAPITSFSTTPTVAMARDRSWTTLR